MSVRFTCIPVREGGGWSSDERRSPELIPLRGERVERGDLVEIFSGGVLARHVARRGVWWRGGRRRHPVGQR